MKSKSSTKFKAATMQITTEMPMLSGLESRKSGTCTPKKLAERHEKTSAIAPVAATTPSLKFSVALIQPVA